VAEGSYLAMSETGEAVMARIPTFQLIPPQE